MCAPLAQTRDTGRIPPPVKTGWRPRPDAHNPIFLTGYDDVGESTAPLIRKASLHGPPPHYPDKAHEAMPRSPTCCKHLPVRSPDLLGDEGGRWRVLRTSNIYAFTDPAPGRRSAKSFATDSELLPRPDRSDGKLEYLVHHLALSWMTGRCLAAVGEQSAGSPPALLHLVSESPELRAPQQNTARN